MHLIALRHRRRPGALSAGLEGPPGGLGTVAGILAGAGLAPRPGASCPGCLPFSSGDATAGSENELQTAVAGERCSVDLPLAIQESNYYANVMRRAVSGDAPERDVSDLERFLANNPRGVWENSWVRFPRRRLSRLGEQTLRGDLLADKRDPSGGLRSDAHRFLREEGGEAQVRIPVSYLLKLALADCLGSQPGLPAVIRQTGYGLLRHFLSDNTSPETFSFHVVPLRPETGMGRALAREAAKRFLLTHLLAEYANLKFALRSLGQEVVVYFSSHPPARQRELSSLVSDSFYRELFVSPCLSGWDTGEKKYRYMLLCHEVLSRSQLNCLARLREARILRNGLVTLPSTSSVSLANNGTHISLGSRRLTELLKERRPGFGPVEEKYVGDLAIKIAEHFLPLFVGTYTGDPFRISFPEFHPETVLGFLPHELEDTHLRMLWRRWKGKACIRLLGRPLTPFGPRWLDAALAWGFKLKGDVVRDFRLLDYPAALKSTVQSPALDGTPGNLDRLKQDLKDLGIFDTGIAPYLLYRLREFAQMGFSGFEGRHYSLFPDLAEDMAHATNLQVLLTALAFKYMATGAVSHEQIPDVPFVESERRQIFFAAAIGLPTFYVRVDTENRFLKTILAETERTRHSRRYPGFVRVSLAEYLKALVRLIVRDGEDLVEALGLDGTLLDLSARIQSPASLTAAGRLIRGILETCGTRSAISVDAREFNQAAESYYRCHLRLRHLKGAMDLLVEDLGRIEREQLSSAFSMRRSLAFAAGESDPREIVARAWPGISRGESSLDTLVQVINLLLISIQFDAARAEHPSDCSLRSLPDAPPVHRAGNW